MNTKELESLRLNIRYMKRHQPLYKLLKEELSLLGHWKDKPRGKSDIYHLQGRNVE